MPSDPDVITARISTRLFSGRDKSEEFREVFGKRVLRVEMDALGGHALQAEMNVRAIPGVAVAHALLSPMRCTHTSDMLDNDDPVLVFVQKGTAAYTQNHHEVTLQPGDAVWTTNGLPGVGISHTETELTHWRFSRALLAPLVRNLDDAIGRLVPRQNTAMPLFLKYSDALHDFRLSEEPGLRRIVSAHLLELAALTLNTSVDGEEAGTNLSVAAARLQGIKAHIRRSIADPALSISTVARREGISSGYVRKLFEAEGTNFTEFVQGLRLSLVYRMLTETGLSARPIREIAQDCGFSDISNFNKVFRAAYKCSPSDVRRVS